MFEAIGCPFAFSLSGSRRCRLIDAFGGRLSCRLPSLPVSYAENGKDQKAGGAAEMTIFSKAGSESMMVRKYDPLH